MSAHRVSEKHRLAAKTSAIEAKNATISSISNQILTIYVVTGKCGSKSRVVQTFLEQFSFSKPS
jgi:hypothetical protein